MKIDKYFHLYGRKDDVIFEEISSPLPEYSTDEWCTDCKEYDQERHCCPRFNHVIRTTLQDAQRTGRWIPVSERLPEDGTWNIFTDGKRVSIERYKMDIISHFFPAGRFFKLEDAVAWMPLPEPYEEEQE